MKRNLVCGLLIVTLAVVSSMVLLPRRASIGKSDGPAGASQVYGLQSASAAEAASALGGDAAPPAPLSPSPTAAPTPVVCPNPKTQSPILPAGQGEDLEVTGDCEVDGKVNGNEYHYHNVNIYTSKGFNVGGTLRFDDAKIKFRAESILVENGGTLRAGTPAAPIGTNGSLTIFLYGNPNMQTDPGITCKSPGETCGVPTAPTDIWNSNPNMIMKMRRPTSCASLLLGNGITDCFYKYDVFDKGDIAGAYFGHKVLAVSYGGSLQLYGKKGATICDPSQPGSEACKLDADPSKSGLSWVRLAKSAKPTDMSLTVDRDVSGWNPAMGETVQIVLTTTDYVAAHSEVVTVKSAQGTTIEINQPIAWPHNGQTFPLTNARGTTGPDQRFIDTRAAVGLLTRSIRIVSEGDAAKGPLTNYFGGHTLARQGFNVFQVQGVEFQNLGQGGSIGHYPVHFHMDRQVPKATTFVKDSSINVSMTRWITIHATQGALVARNVGYKSIGHGFYIEDGTEIDNRLYTNLGVFARSATDGTQNPLKVPGILVAPNYPAAPTDNFPYYSDANHPSVFWIMNGWNDFEYNMAAGAGTCGACYWLVPGANSGPSLYQYWGTGYAAEQNGVGRASTSPLYKFVGNSCVSAMTAFQTVQSTDPCFGILGQTPTPTPAGSPAPTPTPMPPPVYPHVHPLSPPGAPVPAGSVDNETYYPITNGGGRFGTLCPAGKDCSSSDPTTGVPRCDTDKVANCKVTVLDRFTSSFNWAPTNFSALWLRSGWYLLINSAISDVLNGGVTMVTGGGYTLSDAPLGYWGLTRKTAFVGNTQTCDATKCDNPFALNSGPVNPFSAEFAVTEPYKKLTCEKLSNGAYPGNVCFNRDFDLSIPFSNFANNQRLYNIYDGPSYQDSDAYLDINPTVIPLTDCKPQENNGNPCANTSAYMQLQNGVTGIPQGVTMPQDPKKEPEIGQCYLPNAAIAWKQPNGFFYPPAFHSINLSFDNVDIRHFVIEPEFDPTDPHLFWTDYGRVQKRYCTYNNQVKNNYFALGVFNGFTDVDRQTELSDDDGSLTGLKNTISVNEDPFFNAPVETSECASDTAIRPLTPGGTAKTSPYEYVTTVLYPDCAVTAPTEGRNPKCDAAVWYQKCTTNSCYGVPMFRESITPQDGGSAQPIILAGQSVYQRSSLSVDHATYYIDTTVNQTSQENAIIPSIPSENRNLSVFQKGMKFYVFLLYAKPTSQQKYQLYVGKKFDKTKVSQLSLVQVSPLSAPYTIKDLGALPAAWNPQVDSNGILTVNVDVSKLPNFATQYAAAKKAACQPVSFCKPKIVGPVPTPTPKGGLALLPDPTPTPNPTPTPITYCGCNLTDDPKDPVQHDLYEQCKDTPTTGYSPICGWAGKDIDCPEGGCYGFAVTLAPDFENTARIAPPAVNCIKMSDTNFNISFKTVTDTVAGTQCTYPSAPQGMFCK